MRLPAGRLIPLTDELEITVNGEAVQLPAGSTVAELVAARGLRPEQVAVEVNREIVPRASHAEHLLASGDRIEIVTMVGGG